MRILFNHGAPEPLIPFLKSPTVSTTKQMGWGRLSNGHLLKAAEEAEFAVLLTTDKNMTAQLNMRGRAIAIVVPGNSQWRLVQRHVRKVASSLQPLREPSQR